MTTLAKPLIQDCAGYFRKGRGHMIEFAQDLAILNKQRAKLVKLRHQIGLERKSIRDIGITQFDLIWAYSSQITVNGSEQNSNI